MSDWPRTSPPKTRPTFISTLSPYSPAFVTAAGVAGGAGQDATLTWVANLAIFVPMNLPFQYPVKRVFWENGSTVGGNADFGIYDEDGNRIFSVGSTVTAGASGPQFVDVSDFLLDHGRYYFATTFSGTTSVARGFAFTAIQQRMMGSLQQTSAGPGSLPATMASAAAVANALYPVCGVTKTTTGF